MTLRDDVADTEVKPIVLKGVIARAVNERGVEETATCPHCLTKGHMKGYLLSFPESNKKFPVVRGMNCPSCGEFLLFFSNGKKVFTSPDFVQNRSFRVDPGEDERMLVPRVTGRPPAPKEVPAPLARDYGEACLVLADSPNASAALSRRLLQTILRQAGGVKKQNLAQEIDEAIANHLVPSNVGEQLDAVREIGNFAAHPEKSQTSGEVVEVEVGEAEWNLDVVELLFDHFYVKPARIREKKDALNKKLKDAGKKTL